MRSHGTRTPMASELPRRTLARREVPVEGLSREALHAAYAEKRPLIQQRLREFRLVWERGDDRRLFVELAFCIFAAGTSALQGFAGVRACGDVLHTGDAEELARRLKGQYRFWSHRAHYIAQTREHLRDVCGLRLRDYILGFSSPEARREAFALEPRVRGIGMKEASHFLRNIGYRRYGILDTHIVRSLHALGRCPVARPPTTPSRYRGLEAALGEFAEDTGIEMDELDLLLWSNWTGEILK
jgi:N-glycosylase/DNA lyase